MHQCRACNLFFTSRAPNALYCSDKCRAVVKDSSHREYHRAKARLHSSKKSKEDKALSNRNCKIKKGLGVLSDKICTECSISFMPKSHNVKTCSVSCRKIQRRRQRRDARSIKYKLNPNFRLSQILRSRVSILLKSGSAVRDLGCSIDEFKEYLESKFQNGMSWNNHGVYGWHIDHIKRLADFDLTDSVQFKEAAHYTNLQPLWREDHLVKTIQENLRNDICL